MKREWKRECNRDEERGKEWEGWRKRKRGESDEVKEMSGRDKNIKLLE